MHIFFLEYSIWLHASKFLNMHVIYEFMPMQSILVDFNLYLC